MEKGKIYAAMAAIMLECGAIGKDKRNEQQRFQYRGIDDVYNEMHGLMAKHGVFVIPTVVDVKKDRVETKDKTSFLNYVHITCNFKYFADDGSFVEAVTAGEAMDSADKATNKAQSAAQKYCILQTFLIPTKDLEDADATTPQPAAPPRATPPKTAAPVRPAPPPPPPPKQPPVVTPPKAAKPATEAAIPQYIKNPKTGKNMINDDYQKKHGFIDTLSINTLRQAINACGVDSKEFRAWLQFKFGVAHEAFLPTRHLVELMKIIAEDPSSMIDYPKEEEVPLPTEDNVAS